ncbi:SUKH-4 family immunity protein [Streptomyces sp. NPDC093094]|uniref:SUKH-4 family immunity protein n=1 Tax=Streptomyces sp. NPDC093094 TaxID=3366026 RepID=UPI0037F32AF4
MKSNGTPGTPDAAWLEERLGQGSLWRPAEAALPAELTHAPSREFLLTVGFPAVRLDDLGIDTRCVRDKDGLHPFDADELYGNRYPDDDSPPENFCFTVALWGDQHLMLDAADGGITHYDPNGWDHAEGWQGPAAESLQDLAVLLGMIAEAGGALDSDDDARAAAAAELRDRLVARDPNVQDSAFWDGVFEDLE